MLAYWKFESISLQQGVYKLSIPRPDPLTGTYVADRPDGTRSFVSVTWACRRGVRSLSEVNRGGVLRTHRLGGRPQTVQPPGLCTPASRRTTPLQGLIDRAFKDASEAKKR